MTLVDISTETIFTLFLIFCRVGVIMMFIPGIAEVNVSVTLRLLFGIAISMLVATALAFRTPFPTAPVKLFNLVIIEGIIGISIGLASRALLSSIHILGVTIASQSGLSSAMLFDPSQSSQGSIFGNFLNIVVIVLILSFDLHLVIVKGIALSYERFPLGQLIVNYNDFINSILITISNAFSIAIRLSSPYLVASLLLYIGSGVLSKLIPQVQIFFIILPAQILLTIIVMLFSFAGMIIWFIEQYQEYLNSLFGL